MNTPRGIKSARPVIALLFVAFVSGVCACGGGGGGGGGGSTGGTGVRVLHGSIDSVPVDVVSSSSSSVVVSQAMFGLADSYKSLRSGAQILSLTKAFNTSQVVDSFSVDYAAGARYSILLYGDHGAFGVRTALIPDEFPASFDGSLVRVVDGMTGASALTVTASGAAPSLSASERPATTWRCRQAASPFRRCGRVTCGLQQRLWLQRKAARRTRCSSLASSGTTQKPSFLPTTKRVSSSEHRSLAEPP